MPKLGLYLHIPFCRGKCHYCDFCSAPAGVEERHAYVEALCRHLAFLAPEAHDYTVDTVYLGGGTPTLLHTDEIAHILATVRAHYALEQEAEITTECNPVTDADGLFEGLLAAGVNRVSIGLQSIHGTELKALGRLHDFADFQSTYAHARHAGVKNISADLMFGIPHQTVSSFRQTLEALCDLSPEHISAYGLRIEEGTPFWQMRDTLPLPTEDEEAEMAELVATHLPTHGYARYEISNYARPGRESRHNLRYWLGAEYLGLGPAAHSYFKGERFEIAPDTAAYVATAERGDFASLFAERYTPDAHEQREEYVMLHMRLAAGVDKQDFLRRFGIDFTSAYGDLSTLVQGGFLQEDAQRVAFTARGMQMSNAILSDWLDFGGNA